jgi:hypothetical protein
VLTDAEQHITPNVRAEPPGRYPHVVGPWPVNDYAVTDLFELVFEEEDQFIEVLTASATRLTNFRRLLRAATLAAHFACTRGG